MTDTGEEHAALREAIASGDTALGIELGSTRIKATLVGPSGSPIATGSHAWSNRLVDRLWTYDLEAVVTGLQDCFAHLAADVEARHDVPLTTVGALGCSAMMHGYLALDQAGALVVPFRTWRNTNTDAASKALTDLLSFAVPHRWSAAHLYQAVLDDEEHLPRLAHLTTLAGYVHWRLTGRRVLGVGDASGMFPIDPATAQFDESMVRRFDGFLQDHGHPWRWVDIAPTVLVAGDDAGSLTEDGARLLDPSGRLTAGAPCCPPEGDAGTGMVATNSVTAGTGNVSAGTSIFAMVVLDGPMTSVHPEIDIVATPTGESVAMVHCNNGTGDLDAWVGLFGEFATAVGLELEPTSLFQTLFTQALAGDADAGGLMAYNFLSGEPIAGLDEGRPLFVRGPDSRFTLANFIRAHLYATLGALSMGMEVLRSEGVSIGELYAHGGLFTTKEVGQRMLATALDTPVSVGEVAGEGGPWGMALLAAYRRDRTPGQSLGDFLDTLVFDHATTSTISPEPAEVAGFGAFLTRFRSGLPVEGRATELL